ncbi:hypothetical protein Forpe1208_v012778 [Fusarium oxysporum f. sp. rapae]|uniref:Metallo-beta-lactamase domain-containing protein n=1 Tax=Fusarium oxysporum f. sp. rapae TaxID=485398 RepID=A0A8J5U0L2_FUSOX|nr:hypothetical protein Forpe1208_v012778 [Fusarium oxysporum f. sp. rapae]
MDGGRDVQGLKAGKVILLGLETIIKIHNIKRPFLRAWVVTHWDKDHFQGFLDLLKEKQLERFVIVESFRLYCATNLAAIKRASKALEISKIKPNVTSGVEVLGHDFFGQDPNKADAGFWCVGGDGYSYAKGVKIPPEPQKINNVLKNLVQVSKKGGKPTPNEQSLMAAIIWPKGGAGKPRFSYFSAGDGNFSLEKDNICPHVFQKQPVKAFKLDHHGSSGEFSRGEVLEGMNLPRRLIVTPGHQYGHPCWDVLFQIRKMYTQYKQAHGGKLLYTTRLPYWVDESKFGKWLATDLNINPNGRLKSLLDTSQSSKSEKRLLTGKESQKAVDKALKEAREQEGRVDGNIFMKKTFRESDDEDEEDDPSFTYEDGLGALLSDIVHNQGTAYDSVYDRATRELQEAADKGKYEMEEEGREEKPFKAVDEDIEVKYDVVDVCVKMWNSISEQQIKEGVAQSKYYLLQLISANDDELDGDVKAFEWPENWGWLPKAKI